MGRDRDTVIALNQQLINVDHLETAIAHYETLQAEVDAAELKLLDQVAKAKKEMMRALEPGERLKTMREHFKQLMECVDDGEFDEELVKEEAFRVVTDATGSPLSHESELTERLNKIIAQLQNYRFTPPSDPPFLTLGSLTGVEPLKTPRRGRGRGRLVKPTQVSLAPVFRPVSPVSSVSGQSSQFADINPEQHPELNSVEARVTEPPTKEDSEDSFSRKITRPESVISSPLLERVDLGRLTIGRPFHQENQLKEDPARCSSFVLESRKYELIEQEVCHGDFNKPMGITAKSNGEMIVSDTMNDLVHVHDGEMRRIATLRLPDDFGFEKPTAALATDDGLIFVKDDTQIHVFNGNTYQKSFPETPNHKFNCGLMLHQGAIWTVADDAYLIAYSTSDFRQTSKVLINWKNSLDKKPRFRFARNHAGHFYLACMANCQVVIVDQNGEIRNIAGAGYGRAFDQFAQPAGLTHDSVGNFIIADSKNHRFLHFGVDGSARGELVMNVNLKRPADCYLTESGLLYVATLAGRAHIFKVNSTH